MPAARAARARAGTPCLSLPSTWLQIWDFQQGQNLTGQWCGAGGSPGTRAVPAPMGDPFPAPIPAPRIMLGWRAGIFPNEEEPGRILPLETLVLQAGICQSPQPWCLACSHLNTKQNRRITSHPDGKSRKPCYSHQRVNTSFS